MLEEDVKTEGGEETTTEESSTTDEKTVPYDRFKEVNDSKKGLEEEVKTLKDSQPDKLTPEQEKEKQAEEYLSGLVKKELDKSTKVQKDAEVAEEQKFDRDVQDVLDENQDIKKADFLAFVEKEGDTFTTVKGAMSIFKQIGKTAKTAKAEGIEEEQAKPELPSSEGGTVESTEPPKEDANRTLSQVVQDVVKGMTKKSE